MSKNEGLEGEGGMGRDLFCCICKMLMNSILLDFKRKMCVCVQPNFMIFSVDISLWFYVDLITMNLPAFPCGIAFSIRFIREEIESKYKMHTRMYTHDDENLE